MTIPSPQCSPMDDDSSPGLSQLPVRMLNEYAYCPRLFHLMHVEGKWADNAFTVEGRVAHRRVDQLDHLLPDADSHDSGHDDDDDDDDDDDAIDSQAIGPGRVRCKPPARDNDAPPTISRSVPLGSDTLGLTAKLDLVATAPGPDGQAEAVPVETKRGRVPNNPQRSWEPERVQLMAQGLLLREQGYRSDHGVLYFTASRTRVDVPFTLELETLTRNLIAQARQAAHATTLPEPLDDSPKCHGCSLNGICLPDETLALRHLPVDDPLPPATTPGDGQDHAPSSATTPGKPSWHRIARMNADEIDAIRRLYPARDNALPLYIQEQGAYVGKSGENLIVRREKIEVAKARIKDTSQLVLCGNIQVSTQTTQLLCQAGIPVVYLSMGHWFYGITQGITLRNAYDRAAQHNVAADPDACLALAKDIVLAKGMNQRTMLRRNADSNQSRSIDTACADIADLLQRVPDCPGLGQLLGMEGLISAKYFGHFAHMLRPRDFDAQWDFSHRNRRPPRDPVNALLSFGYALLAKECTVALLAEGLDPWWGFYHQPRHGRPALALDLMEPFRPLIVDSAVLTAINTGMVTARNFTTAAAGCMLNPAGRKAFLRAYEARLDQLVTHPLFDYRCAWRSMIQVQARLLSRWLRGDVPRFINITTR